VVVKFLTEASCRRQDRPCRAVWTRPGRLGYGTDQDIAGRPPTPLL